MNSRFGNLVNKYARTILAGAVVIAMAGAAVLAVRPASAQGPQTDPQIGIPEDGDLSAELELFIGGPDDIGLDLRGGLGGGLLACSTTDYTDVAAKALGLTAAELRYALASGQSLSEIAASKSVDLTKVQEALQTARNADIDQAVKDGLLSEAEATALKEALKTASTMSRGRMGGLLGGLMGGHGLGLFGISARNNVNFYPVVATALNTSCADLVKAMQGGKSIATLASEKSVQLQTVIDAVVKAYGDALDKDLSEGLISRAEAERAKANLTDRALSLLSQRGGMMGPRIRIFGGGQGPLDRGNDPRNPGAGKGGRGGTNPTDPTATPTPSGSGA